MKAIRHLIIAIAAICAVNCVSAQKLVGSGTLRFGWKLERCIDNLSNLSNYVSTTDPFDTDIVKFSYSPASWEGIEFDGAVLDFYKDKLYQIGFSRVTTVADRTTFKAVMKRLTEVYGSPRQLKADDPDHLLWTAKGGNMAMLEYVYKDGTFSTFLMLIDKDISFKKSLDHRK